MSCNKEPLSTPEFRAMQHLMTDPRDGEVYHTIDICGQTWMAENLRYDLEGTWRENLANPSNEYGKLYNLSKPNQLCPSGWHLSSESDWQQLEACLGMSPDEVNRTHNQWYVGVQGVQLKSTQGWNSDGDGTNASGFNALPAGLSTGSGGAFSDISKFAVFRTSTLVNPLDSTTHYVRMLSSDRQGIYKIQHNSTYEWSSCRCVQD